MKDKTREIPILDQKPNCFSCFCGGNQLNNELNRLGSLSSQLCGKFVPKSQSIPSLAPPTPMKEKKLVKVDEFQWNCYSAQGV